MDGFAHLPKAGVLFAEDFDAAAVVAPEPEVIEPVFSAAELSAAREEAWQDGYDSGLRAVAENDAAAARQTLNSIAEQLSAERAAAAERSEQVAEEIAGLLLDSLAAMFPALCARHGDAEVRAIVRTVLPALTQEQAITVRVHPSTVGAVSQEVGRLDPDLATHVHIVECDAVSPGDVRIAWRNGSTARDATDLWQQVAEVLMPAGLMRANVMIRETIDGR